MTPLSQQDPRWSSLKINNTQYTVGGYGCFITCVCMVAGIEPPEALKKLQFDRALLTWESIKNIGLEPLEKAGWDNAKALEYVQANGQCISRVDWDGNQLTDKDTHFVVLIGNRQLIDPIDGKIKPTSAYKIYTGIRACRKVESMTSDEIAVKKTDFERLVSKSTMLDEMLAKYNVPDSQALYNMIAGKDSRITDISNQLGTAQAEVKNKEEIISRLNTLVLQNQDDIDLIEGKLDIATNTVAQLGKDKGTLAIENEQLKIQIETLKQQQQQGQVTLTIADIFKLIWSQKITITKG